MKRVLLSLMVIGAIFYPERQTINPSPAAEAQSLGRSLRLPLLA
jgi:hypothetical protein